MRQRKRILNPMDAIPALMNVTLLKNNYRIVSIVCAIMLFLAVLNFPIEYYTILRIVVFAGALLVVSNNLNVIYWIVLFLLIALLFNPIFPVYLREKGIWIPIDIICGILFIVEALQKKKAEEEKEDNSNLEKNIKTYSRDKIH
jgi:energy-coupling factor transporter transmembrane protein EcfT